MDDTLTSKTHAWTYKQVCKDAHKANEWHKQAYRCTERKREGYTRSNLHPEMPPKWLHPNNALWVLGITNQDQARGGRQARQSLELEKLTQT